MPEFIAHTVEGSTSGRSGPGRWSVVMTPCPGVLWTNDVDAVGFQPVDQVSETVFDSTDIDEQIKMGVDAGRTATEIFDRTAPLVGKSIHEGELSNWGKPTTRLTMRKPNITAREILDATRSET